MLANTLLDNLKLEYDALKSGLALETSRINSRRDSLIELRGKLLIDFANWDFLGINTVHAARVARAAQFTIEYAGVGSRSPRLLSGFTLEHLACERRLAKFLNTESALLFSSKNQAIFTLFSTILNERDVVLMEENSTAPALDAAYLLNASVGKFSLKDLNALGTELEKFKQSRRKFVVVETLSALTGYEAELSNLSNLCSKYDANLVVDISVALGVCGLRGEGFLSTTTLSPFCFIADLGLSLGLFGGFIAGPLVLTRLVERTSRNLSVEAMIPPSIAASIETAIDAVELAHGARDTIKLRSLMLSSELTKYKIAPVSSPGSPIVAISFSKPSKAEALTRALFERGFYAETAERKLHRDETSFVRFLISIHHNDRQILDLATAIAELSGRI